jgi:uncharacterized RDD family membrane protein YckC
MESNPYAAPRASLDVGPVDAFDLERRKASRGRRLGGAMIDGAVFLVAVVPAVVLAGSKSTRMATGLIVLLLVVGILAANLVLLYQSGQTIGKKLLGTQIVRTDGSRASLGRIILLRILPIRFLGAIPYLGALVVLIDSLMIFGKDVRCLHDQIADTIVIDI